MDVSPRYQGGGKQMAQSLRAKRASVGGLAGLAVVAALFAPRAAASNWLDSFDVTFDTSVRMDDAGALKRGQILVERFQAAPEVVETGMSANVQIAALARNGDALLYVPDVGFELADLPVTPRDVVRRESNGASTVFLRGSDMGLAANVRIDALALAGTDVLFSVDAGTAIADTAVSPADVLRWNGSAVSILYAARSLGLASGLNLTGLERLANGDLLMAFDTAGRVAGVSFEAGEILRYAPSSAHWSLALSRSQLGVQCSPCKLNDFAASGNPDVIFRSGMERYED